MMESNQVSPPKVIKFDAKTLLEKGFNQPETDA